MMGSRLLTTSATIQCPHGGIATLTTNNQRVGALAPVLVESDIHVVSACSFMRGNTKSPCVKIEWSAGAARSSVGGEAPLVTTSLGSCYSAESALQGTAIVVDTQQRVSSQ
jgi:hypothetical protein